MKMKTGVRKKLPLYLQIEAILKSKILTGQLKEGDRLPPENIDEKIILRLSGEMDELLSIGKETETTVLRSEVIQGLGKPIQYLKLNQTDRICFVEKVRHWKTTPIMVVEEYAPQSLIGTLPRNKKSTESLYFILTRKKGFPLKEATQTIESSTADERIAPLLQIEMGSPLFYMERIFYEEKGLPVLFQISYTRADRLKFSVHLGREQKEKEIKWVVY